MARAKENLYLAFEVDANSLTPSGRTAPLAGEPKSDAGHEILFPGDAQAIVLIRSDCKNREAALKRVIFRAHCGLAALSMNQRAASAAERDRESDADLKRRGLK